MEVTFIKAPKIEKNYVVLRDGKIISKREMDRELGNLFMPLRDDIRELLEGTKLALDKFNCHLKKHSRVYKLLGMASVMFIALGFRNRVYAANADLDNCFNSLENVANTILDGLQRLASTIAVVACIFNILSCIVQGNPKDILGIVIKYGLALLAIYTVEPLYNVISHSFG